MKEIFITFFIFIAVMTLPGCTENNVYPAVGQVVYCPSCDRNLYQRVEGTSRTAYRRADYTPLYFDIEIPTDGNEQFCPFCKTAIAQFENGYVSKVYYRDKR